MLPGRQDLIGGQFPRDHPGVPGVLPEPAHMRILLRLLPAAPGRVRVQLKDQPVRRVPQLPERLGPGRLRR
jgi:hypothetical protein